MRTLPFAKGVGACWPDTVGGPSFHRILLVLREMRTTVEVGRKLARISPSGNSLRPLARSHLGFVHPSFDTLSNFGGYLAHAIQQHVAIAQQNTVVVLARMTYFPEHLAAPIRFQDYATFERKATEEVVLWIASVVVQRSALSQIAGKARGIRHLPRVDYLAL